MQCPVILQFASLDPQVDVRYEAISAQLVLVILDLRLTRNIKTVLQHAIRSCSKKEPAGKRSVP